MANCGYCRTRTQRCLMRVYVRRRQCRCGHGPRRSPAAGPGSAQQTTDPGPVEAVKSQICENASLCAAKYEADFAPYLPQFVDAIWHVLVTTDVAMRYDGLVCTGISFLSSIAGRPMYRSLFEQQGALTSICERVIIPNIALRPCDEELFEDSEDEYIQRDLEGADADTRRRAACDLIHALGAMLEAEITAIFSQYITTMLQRYTASPDREWRVMDATLYLITALTAKGTAGGATTRVNHLVSVEDFLKTHAMPTLLTPPDTGAVILKADVIKYVITFRRQLTQATLQSLLPRIVAHLACRNYVVHSYAACALWRIVSPSATAQGCLTCADIQPHLADALKNIIAALNMPKSTENPYLMKGTRSRADGVCVSSRVLTGARLRRASLATHHQYGAVQRTAVPERSSVRAGAATAAGRAESETAGLCALPL